MLMIYVPRVLAITVASELAAARATSEQDAREALRTREEELIRERAAIEGELAATRRQLEEAHERAAAAERRATEAEIEAKREIERERELRPYARTAAAAAYSRSRLIDRRPRRRCASRGDAASTARSRLSVRRRVTLALDPAAGDRSRLRPGLIERWRAPLAMCGWWWVW